MPPYDDLGEFTLWDAITRYWYWLIAGLVTLLFMVGMTLWVLHLNRELKKAKKRLEQQHELILDSVADGIYGVDLHGNSTFFNRAAEELTGWKAEDVIGKNQHRLLHHSHADGTPYSFEECPVYQTFCDSQSRYISDDLFWRQNGASFPVEYSSTPIKDEKGRTIGSVVVFRDITEQKQAEEDARQHQAELARAARLSTLGEMASGIAHEINQPLTAISTNAQASIRLLESNPPDTSLCVEVMDRIASQAARAGEIIRQLRRFVKKEPLERSEIDINSLVNAVVVLINAGAAPRQRQAGAGSPAAFAGGCRAAYPDRAGHSQSGEKCHRGPERDARQPAGLDDQDQSGGNRADLGQRTGFRTGLECGTARSSVRSVRHQ